MKPYAVIETGGKQYRVETGNKLNVEKLDHSAGEKIEIHPVLALSDGNSLTVGTPHIDSAKVAAVVLDQIRGKKIVSFKKKRRKGYSRKRGHRQSLTVLQIESIK